MARKGCIGKKGIVVPSQELVGWTGVQKSGGEGESKLSNTKITKKTPRGQEAGTEGESKKKTRRWEI